MIGIVALITPGPFSKPAQDRLFDRASPWRKGSPESICFL